MKRIILFLLPVLAFAACQQGQQQEIETLTLEKQAIQAQMEQKDSILNSFLSSLNEIEENLQMIKEKEGRITQSTGSDLEAQPDLIKDINEDVRLVGELMDKNRELISRLNRDFKSSNLRISELDKMLSRLNEQLEEKEIEISILRDELERSNIRVEFLTASLDTLESQRRQQEQLIRQTVLELNTAWFAMGSKDELSSHNIILREGGFLGLGKTTRVNPDAPADYFTRVDITNTPEITIPGKDPRVLSSHPEESWKLKHVGDVYYLEILDYRKFWNTSRRLVIEIE